ncbi:hypothetical protein HanXRQr2_Chr04g0150691 [Helianthus annuus]|uniref:Uncharacterized protein n=1 Tax=Helianthus annuus TaxID=4232 RepID=A0A9K3J5R2_HELAN|nr:hypothetical protein HanXRQr2_Chr04g0150691 [Helianthus annuus]KAJ0595880.1 hypothetical protein HanHA89_Chr04g0136401 [Helianthus annuus]KAJ0756539.1 hypothetical protein HanLR1_Chr04g0128261 [Helianthus annuus]
MLIIRMKTGDWSLFDFVDPPRNAALRPSDRVVGEHEASVQKIHIEHFLLTAILRIPLIKLLVLPPSSGCEASLGGTKKASRIRITGKKSTTSEVTTSPEAAGELTAPEGATVTSAPAIVSPRPAPKRRRTITFLSTFQTTKTAQLLHTDTIAEAQVEGGSSLPLTSGEIATSAIGGQSVSLAELISQASVLPVCSLMPPPLFTAFVMIITNPVSTPLFSSSTPTSMFDSPMGDFPVSGREIPTTSAGGESTTAKEMTVSDTGGPIGLDNEHLMNTTMVDAVSGPRRLAEIRRRWMHDNNELHQARMTIQELVDEKSHLESQLHAASVREGRFLLEKNKVEDDLKHVTANLAEERITSARDVVEKEHIISHAKAVQEELERKAVNEARMVRSELSTEMERYHIDTDFVYQVQERYQGLTLSRRHLRPRPGPNRLSPRSAKKNLESFNKYVTPLSPKRINFFKLLPPSRLILRRRKVLWTNPTLRWIA